MGLFLSRDEPLPLKIRHLCKTHSFIFSKFLIFGELFLIFGEFQISTLGELREVLWAMACKDIYLQALVYRLLLPQTRETDVFTKLFTLYYDNAFHGKNIVSACKISVNYSQYTVEWRYYSADFSWLSESNSHAIVILHICKINICWVVID